MALSDIQKLDVVFKALVGRESTYTGKAWYEEFPAHTTYLHTSEIYADDIPETPPATDTDVIRVFDQYTLTKDPSVPNNRCWKVCVTPGDPNSGAYTHFVHPRFGQGYTARIYDANGTEITTTALKWIFIYETGVLIFEEDPVAAGYVEPLKISAYQYIGKFVSDDTLGGVIPGGPDKSVQFNDSGSLNGLDQIKVDTTSYPKLVLSDTIAVADASENPGILSIEYNVNQNTSRVSNTTDFAASIKRNIQTLMQINGTVGGLNVYEYFSGSGSIATLKGLNVDLELSDAYLVDLYGLRIGISTHNTVHSSNVYQLYLDAIGSFSTGTVYALYQKGQTKSYFEGPVYAKYQFVIDSWIYDSAAEEGAIFVSQNGKLCWKHNGNIYELVSAEINPGGPDGAIQFNNSGTFGGSSAFTIDYSAVPNVINIHNSSGTLNQNEGIFQVKNYLSQDSALSGTIYSRNVTISRNNTLNANVSDGRFSNLWIQHFTDGSGQLRSSTNLVCDFGIYATDATNVIDTATGIAITPYVKSGTINTVYGLYLNSLTTGGNVGNYHPIYQKGAYKSIFEGSVVIGSSYFNVPETLRVQGDTAVRGDDTVFKHISDSDDIFFASDSAASQIIIGLDSIKIKDHIDTIPTPESGYGLFYSENGKPYWKDPSGNTYSLISSANPGGVPKSVQYNYNGSFEGSSVVFIDHHPLGEFLYLRANRSFISNHPGTIFIDETMTASKDISSPPAIEYTLANVRSVLDTKTYNLDAGSHVTSLYLSSEIAGAGTIDNVYGIDLRYGVYKTDVNPNLNNTYGIRLRPFAKAGHVFNLYDLYIDAAETGGSIGTHYAIYQADSTAHNYFAGYTTFDHNVKFGNNGILLKNYEPPPGNTSGDPPIPPVGYGRLVAKDNNIYWLTNSGDMFKLNSDITAGLDPNRIVVTDSDNALSTLPNMSYTSGGGLVWNDADGKLLSGYTSNNTVFTIGSTAPFSTFEFTTNYNSTLYKLMLTVSSANNPTYPKTAEVRGSNIDDLRLDFSYLTFIAKNGIVNLGTSSSNPLELRLYGGVGTWTLRIADITRYESPSNPDVLYINEDGHIGLGDSPDNEAVLYAKGNIRYLKSYNKKLKFTVSANSSGWYRIAKSASNGGRNAGLFRIFYTVSGYHGFKHVHVGSYFNRAPFFNVQLLGSSRYSTDPIQQIRILYHTTYDEMYIELYIVNPNGSYDMTVSVELDWIDDGWVLLDTVQSGSVPTDYDQLVYDLSQRIFGCYFGKNTILDVSEQTVRMGKTTRDDSNFAFSARGHAEIFTDSSAPTSIATRPNPLYIERGACIYEKPSHQKIFGLELWNSELSEPQNGILYDASTSPEGLRIASKGPITFAAGQSDIYEETPTNPATLQTDGTFRARFFRPISGYRSVDGSSGITTTVTCDDWNAGIRYTLTFKNGILVAVSSSSM